MQPVPREVIEKLLLGAAPERRPDLQEIWKARNPDFRITQDRTGSTYEASANQIRFNHKSLSQDWIVGYAGWRAFRAYGPAIVAAWLTGTALSADLLGQDARGKAEEQVLDELIYTAQGIRKSSSLSETPWPSGIPEPTSNKAGFSVEDSATFDLVVIAVAVTFLHEIHHVRTHVASQNMSRIEEEKACDAFAKDFLTDKIKQYSTENGQAEASVRMKRGMGLALAGFIIHEATPYFGQHGTNEYLPTLDRFADFIDGTTVQDDSDFWVFASALLLAMLRARGGLRATLPFDSYRELFFKLLEHARGQPGYSSLLGVRFGRLRY
jgi:hypothetical protein